VGPGTGMDGCGKSRPQRDSMPGPPNPVIIPTEPSRPLIIIIIIMTDQSGSRDSRYIRFPPLSIEISNQSTEYSIS